MSFDNGTGAMRATWLKTKAAGYFSTALAGRLASRLWFTPWRIPEGEGAHARRSEWLQGAEPLTVRVGDWDLKGFSAGEGPTVMLVHGWADRASSLGAFIAPLVDRGYRVVGLDLPAHGDTEGEQTDALELAAALSGAADHLGDVHAVVAHSMGAVATMVALRDGLSLRRAVFVSPAVRLERGLDHFVKMYKLPTRAGQGLRTEIERRFGVSVWEDFAADKFASELDLPVLIVHDRKDSQVSINDAQLLADAWPSAHLHITEGLGHTRILRDPQVVEQSLAFLEESLVNA